MVTKTARLLKALASGKEITAEQIENRFGLVNPSATINRLRNQGLTIYTNYSKSKGYRYRAPVGLV